MINPLIFSYLRRFTFLIFALSASPSYAQAYLENYNPKNGFTPAQPSLTTAVLKLAGSLEHHGSPEQYIRHVLAEHERIDAKYLKATGKAGSARPEYFTDEYLANLLGNWEKLEKPLQLEQLCRDSGRYMRHAIRGSWHKTPAELVAEEGKLSAEQKRQYRSFLEKEHFKKSDFGALEAFYEEGAGFENLSKSGKDQVSQRVWLGTQSPNERAKFKRNRKGGTVIVTILNEYQNFWTADKSNSVNSKTLQETLVEKLLLNKRDHDISAQAWNEQDAVRYSHLVQSEFKRRIDHAKNSLGDEASGELSAHFLSTVEDLRILVHSEMHAAVREKWASSKN